MLLNLLYEYVFLQSPFLEEKRNLPKDRYIADLVLMRDYFDSIEIYFLWSSEKLIIPRPWIVLIDGFGVECGGRLNYLTPDPENKVETWVWNFWEFWKIATLSGDGDYGDHLNTLLHLGTKEVRGWFEDKLKIELPEWQYVTLQNTYDI